MEATQADQPVVNTPVDVEDLLVRAAATRPRPALARALRLGLVGLDAVAVAGAMAGAMALAGVGLAPGPEATVAALSLPVWLVVFSRYRLFDARHLSSRREELGRLVHAVGLGALASAGVAVVLDLAVARAWLVTTGALALVGVALEREAVRRGFARARRRGRCLRPVAIAGTGPEALALATAFAEEPELGYRVVALVGQAGEVDSHLLDHGPVLDPRHKLAEQLRLAGAQGVVVATTEVDPATTNRLVRGLCDAGIHVELSSGLEDIDAHRLLVRPAGRHPLVYVEPVRRGGWRPGAKRAFDLALALVVLLACLPVLVVAALAVRATSPGPALFRQERVGRHGRRFRIYKLRTMYADGPARLAAQGLELPAGPVPKLRHDPRVTPVGRLLRKCSVDELPQLINVVRGEMSLVGPRPEQPAEVVTWSPELFERLRVKPGLTGMWQVSGRSDAREAKDRWDLYYVDNWSLWRDVAILAKTIPVVVSTKGAY